MFRSSMRSSSGSSLFTCTSLSMLLILKIIKIFKKYYHPSCLCGSIMWQTHFVTKIYRSFLLYAGHLHKNHKSPLSAIDLFNFWSIGHTIQICTRKWLYLNRERCWWLVGVILTSQQSFLTVGGSNDTSSKVKRHSVQESGVQFQYCVRKDNGLLLPADTHKIPAASQQ